jgi:serine protease SohB
MDFIIQYGFFLLKVVTVVIAILLPILIVINSSKSKSISEKGHLQIKNLSDQFESMGNALQGSLMDSKTFKKFRKDLDKKKKKEDKESAKDQESIFVLNFNGDIQASEVDKLKHEINAILLSETECKEVVLKVESGGGSAYAYGLCAAELKRLVDAEINLTVCIDKVAASGGYLMSCVASKIVAAPWALVGSIGVIAQMPNIHKLLKKNLVDFEMHTAGEFKRTLTVFGENTEEGRDKFKSELEDLHVIFKDFVKDNRPEIDTSVVATGEVWQGEKALEVGLIDEIGTSDDYLVKLSKKFKLFEIEYIEKKNLSERFAFAAETFLNRTVLRIYDTLNKSRFIS